MGKESLWRKIATKFVLLVTSFATLTKIKIIARSAGRN